LKDSKGWRSRGELLTKLGCRRTNVQLGMNQMYKRADWRRDTGERLDKGLVAEILNV
jgi:hypothetical protein